MIHGLSLPGDIRSKHMNELSDYMRYPGTGVQGKEGFLWIPGQREQCLNGKSIIIKFALERNSQSILDLEEQLQKRHRERCKYVLFCLHDKLL